MTHSATHSVPRHIAIIMDGNGRWAQARGLERSQGHVEGVTAVRRITEECSRLGVQYLTLYTFSTENWNRPQAEVDALMYLLGTAIARETPDLIRNNVRLNLVGDISRIPDDARRSLLRSVEDTAACNGLTLSLAISYSARWDLTHAMRNIARDVQQGLLTPDDITDDTVTERLSTYPLPEPDLLIRTGGEQRISNFLLWEIAYSEIYFTDTLWPDYDAASLRAAIDEYNNRERRYGLTSAQISALQQ